MTDIAIRVENLGKQYRIGKAQERYPTLRDAIANSQLQIANSIARLARPLFRHTPPHGGASQSAISDSADSIWALKDVSFEVKRGEVVGIIGRNGAGKSTLLKVLSRITEPTTGRVIVNGRVGSLLEVGTGFHPELTGRENIYLNGAILGMKKAEIERKFDEIVAFAEIEKFLDTPVKHYSSGMYVRLAFAVAAHMEPEILLVDEVLAVGDAAFQRKCLGKMGDVAKEGRTVLFVSHSMPTILRLCERAVLLHAGQVVRDGEAHQVTVYYLSSGVTSPAERVWDNIQTAPGDAVARLRAVHVLNHQKQIAETIDILEPLYIEMEYWNLQKGSRLTAIIHLINEQGVCLFASNDWNNSEWWNTPRTPGLVRATCMIPRNFLAEGQFFVLAAIGTYNPNIIHALVREVVSFQVVDHSEGNGVRGVYAGGGWPGVVRPMLNWEVHEEKWTDIEIANQFLQ